MTIGTFISFLPDKNLTFPHYNLTFLSGLQTILQPKLANHDLLTMAYKDGTLMISSPLQTAIPLDRHTVATTESTLQESVNLDTLPIQDVLAVFNAQDSRPIEAVEKVLPQIQKCRDAICSTYKAGGKLYLTGAGTSLRLANYTARANKANIRVIYCGGEKAIAQAVEAAEDDREQAQRDLDNSGIKDKDMLIGIAASGKTAYVAEAMKQAHEKGCTTGHISCNVPNLLKDYSNYPIEPITGAEVIAGSTRLKAGSAQLLVLLMLTGDTAIHELHQYLQACQAIPRNIADQLQFIAQVAENAGNSISNGGRIIYVGTEYSGLLGTLDASECPPTFGTQAKQVQCLLAGGHEALATPQADNTLDDASQALSDAQASDIEEKDTVIGLAAQNIPQYVKTILAIAHSKNAFTACLSCMEKPDTDSGSIPINIPLTTENSGLFHICTSLTQKMVLNMISSGAMVLNNKVYGNYMVDVVATNEKLKKRQIGIVSRIAKVSEDTADATINLCNKNLGAPHKHCKTAIVMLHHTCSPQQAQEKLKQAKGRLRSVLEAPTELSVTLTA